MKKETRLAPLTYGLVHKFHNASYGMGWKGSG